MSQTKEPGLISIVLSQRNRRPWCAAASAAGASDFLSAPVVQRCHSLFSGCLNCELKALTSALISVPPKPGQVVPYPRACSSFPSVIPNLPQSRLAGIPSALLPPGSALEKFSSVPVLSHNFIHFDLLVIFVESSENSRRGRGMMDLRGAGS